MSLGAVTTTINALNSPNEIADSKPYLAITTSELLPKIRNSGSNLPIVLIADDKIPRSGAGLENFTTLQELMERKPDESRLKERVSQNDTASLLYSSGTTGPSKGVVSYHGNLFAMVQTLIQVFKIDGEDRPQTFICTVPMFHIHGMAVFATGAPGDRSDDRRALQIRDPRPILGDFQAQGELPPDRAAYPGGDGEERGGDSAEVRFPIAEVSVVGRSADRKEVIEEFAERFPEVLLMQGDGMTETARIGSSSYSMEENRTERRGN